MSQDGTGWLFWLFWLLSDILKVFLTCGGGVCGREGLGLAAWFTKLFNRWVTMGV
jgi:hypothetical protein